MEMDVIEYLRNVGFELLGLNDDPNVRESVLEYVEELLAGALEKVKEARDDSDSAT